MRQFSLPTRFEKILAHVSPKMAFRRFMDRQRLELFAYQGGKTSRRRDNYFSLSHPESSSYQSDRVTMLKAARDHAENIGFVNSILLKLATYVTGFLEYQPNTGDPAVDLAYRQYFRKWSRVCDMSGRHSLLTLTGLVLKSVLRDGDIGAEWCERPGFFPGLNMIEADRIGGPYSITTTPNYCGGITFDAWGKPSSYRVYDVTPDNAYGNPHEVPSLRFIHVFDPDRTSQYRGVTAFHAALNSLKDIAEVLENEMLAVKWCAAQGGVVATETGDAGDTGEDYGTDETDYNDNTMRTQAIEPGRINYTERPGSFKAFEYSRPSPAFQGLIRLYYQEVALALGLPYGFVYDLGNLKGPGVRYDLAQVARAVERWQYILLVEKWLEPIKTRLLLDGIANWGLPYHPNFMEGNWRFPASPTIDNGRDSKAAIDEVRAGMRSKRTWFTENGWSPEVEQSQIKSEAIQTIRDAKEISTDEKVPLELAISLLDLRTPNAPPPSAPDAEPANQAKKAPPPEQAD